MAFAAAGNAGVSDTRHNLSSTGPGPLRSKSPMVCDFCHSEHRPSDSPLWNHQPTTQRPPGYGSSTMQAVTGAPARITLQCLSCHDGTVPIGALTNLSGKPGVIDVENAGLGGVMPAGATRIATLTGNHPVSMAYGAGDPELVAPGALTDVRLLDATGMAAGAEVQCTSCHDPHGTPNAKLLRASMAEAALCLRCHEKPGWKGSSHESALEVFPLGSATTVRDLGCAACHQAHGAPAGAPRLLVGGATGGAPSPAQTCLRCHRAAGTGGVAADIASEVAKPFGHRVGTYAGHEPVFTLAPAPESPLLSQRHVECGDCHNPHRATATNKLEGMRGVGVDGAVVDDVSADRDLAEHEVCLRCHGDSVGAALPSSTASGVKPTNKRTELQPDNSSFHPVAAAGRNLSPNLAEQLQSAKLTTADTVLCSDCHNNESTASARGRASNASGVVLGPHGSAHPFLVRAKYRRTWLEADGPTAYDSSDFALCFECHDEAKLMAPTFAAGARTNFYLEGWGGNLHWLHLVDRVGAAKATCANCHFNAHSNVDAPNTRFEVAYRTGVSLAFDSPNRTFVGTHLVNFAPDLLGTSEGRKPSWRIDAKTKVRACNVQCHGSWMGWSYRPPSGDDPMPDPTPASPPAPTVGTVATGESWFNRTAPPLSGSAAGWDGNRGAVAMLTGSEPLVPVMWEWDGAVFSKKPGPAYGRNGNRMTWDAHTSRLVMFGGADFGTGYVLQPQSPQDTWTWNGTTWTQASTVGPVRARPSMAFDAERDRTILFGGYSAGNSLGDTWSWDGAGWTQIGVSGPAPRHNSAMAYDPIRKRVVLFGGFSVNAMSRFRDTWEWDGAAWALSATTGPSAREQHALAWDPNRQRIVLFGGDGGDAVTWEWDGVAWAARAASGPPARSGHALVTDPLRSRVVLIGGYAAGQPYTSAQEVWEWDGTSWQQMISVPPSARTNHAMAFDPVRGRAVLFGGSGSGTPSGETWEWAGTKWQSYAVGGPSARSEHAMAWDAVSKRVLLFGGATGNANGYVDKGDTWQWDGAAWAQLTPIASPSPRYGHTMTWDAGRNFVVLFGGRDRNAILDETWEWEGGSWRQRAPTLSPPPRFGHAMAYDKLRGRTVVFGGISYRGVILADTWEWDGAAWTQGASGPALYDAAMSWDSNRNRVVLFGGKGESAWPGEIWEWNGTTWAKSTATGPEARAGHTLTWDSVRSRVLLFGGTGPASSSGGFNELWEYY